MQKWAAGGELLVWGAAFRPPPGSFAAFPEIAFGRPSGGLLVAQQLSEEHSSPYLPLVSCR